MCCMRRNDGMTRRRRNSWNMLLMVPSILGSVSHRGLNVKEPAAETSAYLRMVTVFGVPPSTKIFFSSSGLDTAGLDADGSMADSEASVFSPLFR